MRKLLPILILVFLIQPVMSQPEVDSLQQIIDKTENDSIKVEALLELTTIFLRRNLEKSVEYGQEAVDLARQSGSLHLQSWALTTLGAAHYYSGNYNKALDEWLASVEIMKTRESQALDSLSKSNFRDQRAVLLSNIGAVYKTMGEYDKAIEYFQENLRIQEEVGNKLQMARVRSNIANVYFAFEIDFEKALEYYKISLELFEAHVKEDPEDKRGPRELAQTYVNLGIVYKELDNPDLARQSFSKALEFFTASGDMAMVARTQKEIGIVLLEEGNYEEALQSVQTSLEYNQEIGQRKEEAEDLKNIGKIYYHLDNYPQALEYMNQSLVISRELDLKREMFDVYRDMSNVYREMGDYKSALENFELYGMLKDSSIRQENLKEISELETRYETDRIERENVLLNTENLLQEAQNKRQKIFLFSVIGISVIILIFGFVVYRQYQEKKRANVLLEEQNIEIKQQRDQIFQQKQEITDSIQYASRIQNAVLPPDTMLSKLQEHFILYKPRDIVSGDYYWMTLKDNKTIVVAADCTGHGVPGAFMSMLGISFMNEIVNKSDTTQANEILNQLRGDVIQSLGQTGLEGEAQDGMDLALCVIDTHLMKVQYSGAYNPLYIIRNGEFIEYKADKMPIGIHKEKSDSFSNHDIDIQVGDALYMFSDGYVDQFGGVKQKKFMTKNFKELLMRITKKPMKEQGEILDKTLAEWMGNVEQIDDILVMGLRI